MKFNDGYWKRIPGISFYTPTEIIDIESEGNKAVIYSSHKPIPHRGETTNATLIMTEIFSPLPDVIGVRHIHWLGDKEKSPQFKLNMDSDIDIDVTLGKRCVELTSGSTRVLINDENGWTMSFYNKDRLLTNSTRKNMGYIVQSDSGKSYMKEQLSIGAGEYVYGFGERFTNFTKNGQVIELWNADGGTASEQAYKNIPFYITSNLYGVFINHSEKVSVEAASEVVSGVGFSVPGEFLEYYVIGGSSLKDIIVNYTKLTGRPSLPPAWSFGLWLTTSFSTYYNADTIKEFVYGMRDRDIPLRVFHFDCFIQKEFQFCDFTWNTDIFENPQELMDEMASLNIKMGAWINPYISQKSKLFAEGKEKGYFLKYSDGRIYQIDFWMPGMAIVDFTNPEASRWYVSYLNKLMDMGVSCFKTDFGENIPIDIVYYDGSDPYKMHNYYSYLYNKVVFNAVEQYYGKGQGLVFARSATTGSQQLPVHWAGDSYSSYESMAETLRGGLSLGLAGFGFWSHDISGFEKTATPDLYKRWCAFGLLSSHSRLHGSESFRVPWLFDEEAVDVLRFFTKLKYKMMPYIFAIACEAVDKGLPMLRSMILEFDDDFVCRTLDMQYMLGDRLLVAPIFSESGMATYYLPDGRWTNILNNEVKKGKMVYTEQFDYFSLPLLVRSNSILPMGRETNMPDYDYAYDVELHIYELNENASVRVYNTEGKKELELCMEKADNIIKVSVETVGKPYSLVFHTDMNIVYGDDKGLKKDNCIIFKPDPLKTEYILHIN